jgi:hypothetical protein
LGQKLLDSTLWARASFWWRIQLGQSSGLSCSRDPLWTISTT